ncbi:MAG: hypothetical protein IR160_02570 [Salinibacterium sp.]|nr:hypothetical protein [Salinibacterium sp.]MBF0671451.1 hypothetical protein [Salinibacterium sp.]
MSAAILALVCLFSAALFGRAMFAVLGFPSILVAIVFAFGSWNARLPKPDGLTTGERRHPGDPGVQTGGAQTYGAAAGCLLLTALSNFWQR